MPTDKKLFYLVSALIAVGIVFSYSLSAFTVLYLGYAPYHFFVRQLAFGLSGIFIMFFISQLNPYKSTFSVLMAAMLALSIIAIIILPFLPANLATASGGAKRWLRLGAVSIAPVEFFKIALIFALAWSYTRRIDYTSKNFLGEVRILLPYIVLSGLAISWIYLTQNDLGQSVICAFLVLSMAFFAGASKRLFGFAMTAALMLALLVIFSSERRIQRIQQWWGNIQDAFLPLFPEWLAAAVKVNSSTEPYQISHSLNAIAHGGLVGEGLGLGTFKLGFLSEVHTDFVLAGITEEVGLLGLGVVCLIYIAVILRVFIIAGRCQRKMHFIFCSGVGLLLLFSFFMNAYGIISVTPLKGVAVPFLSYGGSSMWAFCIAMGGVLMISKSVR